MQATQRRWLLPVVMICSLPSVGCHSRPPSERPAQDSELHDWWRCYRERFISADGRVRRPRNDNDTVSEGQAYAMLSAVMLDDRDTFARVFEWTAMHMSRETGGRADSLLAWRWAAGEVVDWTPASDADCDFAFALGLAALRWNDNRYRARAKHVAQCIMEKEVVRTARGRLVLLPGLWGDEADGGFVQNPSYYNPAAYRLFHQLTGDARWLDLVETSYWVWAETSRSQPGDGRAKLPPDWCLLTPDERLSDAPGRSSSYGWEAVRLPMRIYLDYVLHGEQRGLRIVEHLCGITGCGEQAPKAVYSRDGAPAVEYAGLPSAAMATLACRMSGAGAEYLSRTFHGYLVGEEYSDDYYGQSLAIWPLLKQDSWKWADKKLLMSRMPPAAGP